MVAKRQKKGYPTAMVIPEVSLNPTIPTPKPPAWRWVFLASWIGIFILPVTIFFTEREGLSFLQGLTVTEIAVAMFPLVGLYALSLVWTQVMLGSLMPLWKKIFPNIFIFHRTEGLFALIFAIAHPTLLAFGIGLGSYLARDFISPAQEKFVYFGYTALFVMILTVGTAVLMRKKFISRWWRKIHVLNYLIFAAAWVHSWNLGSDIQSTNLKYLWLWYGASVAIAIILRLFKVGRYSARAI